VTAWLNRHPRFTFHFTPTSYSWAKAVEGLFAKLIRQRLKRGVFTSIVELQAAINRFIAEPNDKPKPFVWTNRPMPSGAGASVRAYPLGPANGFVGARPLRQALRRGTPRLSLLVEALFKFRCRSLEYQTLSEKPEAAVE
jgi:hypothetical protein